MININELNTRNRKSSGKKRAPLVIDFHPALSGLSKIIDLVWLVLYALERIRKVFGEKPWLSEDREI